MFSTPAQPTAAPLATPVYNGGGIDFIRWSNVITDFATQLGLQNYLHPTAVAQRAGSSPVTPLFERLDEPDQPTGKGDLELYKIKFLRFKDQDDKIRNLRASILSSLADTIKDSLFPAAETLFNASGPEIFAAVRLRYSTVTSSERETAFAAASVPAGDNDINIVLHRVATYFRVLAVLNEPLTDPPKIRHLLEVLDNNVIYALLANNYYMQFPTASTRTYDGLTNMATAMYDNRTLPTAQSAALAITPSVSNAVAAAMSQTELRQSIAALQLQLKKATPKRKLVCTYHPNHNGHTTADCSKNPANAVKKNGTTAAKTNKAFAATDSDDETH
jgi:hypothetical protein